MGAGGDGLDVVSQPGCVREREAQPRVLAAGDPEAQRPFEVPQRPEPRHHRGSDVVPLVVVEIVASGAVGRPRPDPRRRTLDRNLVPVPAHASLAARRHVRHAAGRNVVVEQVRVADHPRERTQVPACAGQVRDRRRTVGEDRAVGTRGLVQRVQAREVDERARSDLRRHADEVVRAGQRVDDRRGTTVAESAEQIVDQPRLVTVDRERRAVRNDHRVAVDREPCRAERVRRRDRGDRPVAARRAVLDACSVVQPRRFQRLAQAPRFSFDGRPCAHDHDEVDHGPIVTGGRCSPSLDARGEVETRRGRRVRAEKEERPCGFSSSQRPAKPTSVKVASGVLRVTFSAPADNGAPITSYPATCRATNGRGTGPSSLPSNAVTASAISPRVRSRAPGTGRRSRSAAGT